MKPKTTIPTEVAANAACKASVFVRWLHTPDTGDHLDMWDTAIEDWENLDRYRQRLREKAQHHLQARPALIPCGDGQ